LVFPFIYSIGFVGRGCGLNAVPLHHARVPLELNKLLKVTDILMNPLKQYTPPDSRYSSQLLMKHHDKKTYVGVEV
jgi:hypothetical protein